MLCLLLFSCIFVKGELAVVFLVVLFNSSPFIKIKS
jgi:hypothetical protein